MSNFFAHHVFVCTNRRSNGHKRGSCAARGAEALREYAKHRAKELGLPGTRVNMAGCLDRCELGPVMVIYPDGAWYHVETTRDIDEIFESHILNGQPVERLLLKNDQRDLPNGPVPESCPL